MNDLMNKNPLFIPPGQDGFHEQTPKKHLWRLKIIFITLLILFLISLKFFDFSSHETKFYQAIEKKDYTMIEDLMKNHLPINKKTSRGSYFIFDAILSGDFKLVKMLLEMGADLTVRSKTGSTPLQTAIYMGSNNNALEIIRLLKEFGANLHAEGVIGIPPLYLAASEGYTKIAAYLLDNGADADLIGTQTAGKTPLHIASYYGYTDLVLLLIKKGASVNIKDDKGQTPLSLAFEETSITNRLQAMKPSLSTDEKKGVQQILLKNGAKRESEIPQNQVHLKPLLLKDTPYLFPQKTMEINGNTLSYIDEGSGDAIVFVHGLSTTLTSFNPILKDFLRKKYRIIALDLIGYGRSSKPEIQYSIALHAQNLFLFIQKLGIRKFHLAGHSMGAAVSLLFAFDHPDLIGSLVLLTPGGLEEYPAAVIDYLQNSYENSIGKRYSNPMIAKNYFKSSVYQWNKDMKEFIQIREKQMLDPEWLKVRRTIQLSSFSFLQIGKDILARMDSIKAPVLVLLGKQDMIVSSRTVEENISERVKNWKVQTFDQCGHMIQYDQKDKVIRAIDEFLKNL